MEVTFSPDLERFIDDLVSRGAYPTREDVVRAGIARLQDDGEDAQAEIERVRALVQEGIDSADRGDLLDGEEVMRELRARFVQMAEERGEAA